MALEDRLFPTTDAERENAIAIHSFGAAMREYARGEATRANLLAGLSIAVGQETTDFDLFLAVIDAATGVAAKLSAAFQVEDVIILASGGIAYTSKAAIRTRLGL